MEILANLTNIAASVFLQRDDQNFTTPKQCPKRYFFCFTFYGLTLVSSLMDWSVLVPNRRWQGDILTVGTVFDNPGDSFWSRDAKEMGNTVVKNCSFVHRLSAITKGH